MALTYIDSVGNRRFKRRFILATYGFAVGVAVGSLVGLLL
jgi:hypothetical protein